MADSFEVRGAEQLERLALNLKVAGNGELKKELLRGIRLSNKATIAHIRESAQHTLPGGLGAVVAKAKIGTRTRLSGRGVGVEIKGTGTTARGKKRELKKLNAGSVRHPLFGNRKYWYGQDVEPGFFDDPIKADLPLIREGIKKTMADVARKVQRGV